MAELAEKYKPYAPSGTVITVIRRLREHGLPENVDNTTITRVGVTTGNAGRTVAALKFLGIVDADGNKTEVHDRLARANTDEYPNVLAEIIRDAYSDIFKVVDPANATDIQLNDAFRGFDPQKQRGRMVTLFEGLCQEAGLMEGEPVVVQRRRKSSSRPSNTSNGKQNQQNDNAGSQAGQVHPPPERQQRPPALPPVDEQYEMLAVVFKKLPKNGEWTAEERELWLQGVALAATMEVALVEKEHE